MFATSFVQEVRASIAVSLLGEPHSACQVIRDSRYLHNGVWDFNVPYSLSILTDDTGLQRKLKAEVKAKQLSLPPTHQYFYDRLVEDSEGTALPLNPFPSNKCQLRLQNYTLLPKAVPTIPPQSPY